MPVAVTLAGAEHPLTSGIRLPKPRLSHAGRVKQNLTAAMNRQLHHLQLLQLMDQQLQLGFAKTSLEDANGRQANSTAHPAIPEMLCFGMD